MAETPSESRHEAFYDVQGMRCGGCAGRVTRAIEGVPGVVRASVNLATNKARILVDDSVGDEVVCAAVTAAGYAIAKAPERPTASVDEGSERKERVEVGFGLAASAALMAVAMIPALQFPGHAYAQALLALAVMAWPGREFFVAAWHAGRRFEATMDTLVALGSLAAFVLSATMLVRGHGHHLYFETAAMILAVVRFGRALEARARRRAGAAVRELLALRPDEAVVRTEQGDQTIPASFLRAGDLVVVPPHARLPVDGTVEAGTSAVDESMLTGEPMPVVRATGDPVIGGTTNGDGELVVKATGVGADSRLEKIAKAVEEAQSTRAPIERLVDRASRIFVPGILLVSLGTFVAWLLVPEASVEHAILAALSVLVIACPCAMGLATPAAMVAGLGAAARKGAVVHGAEPLERAAALTTLVVDKTGTLTVGKPVAHVAASADGVDRGEALALAARVSKAVHHPLSRAVVEAAKLPEDAARAESVESIPGRGATGVVDGRRVRVGSPSYAGAEGAWIDDALAGLESEGETPIVVSIDERPVLVLGALDPLRADAHDAVAALRARGIAVHLATGDRAGPAVRIARAVGIPESHVHAAQTPESKAELVRRLESEGETVGFAGDGVNDSPAMATAAVAFAMAAGSDVAVQAAGITLMRNDLRAVLDVLELSTKTRRIVRQNLGWAVGYNFAAVPFAALGMLATATGPMIAAGAMAMSSVSVVTNALRLRRG
ncbi:MAG: cation-translocating P-type ATPase [Polyangiales bacterium]